MFGIKDIMYKYEVIDEHHIRVWNSDRETWIEYNVLTDWTDIVLNDTGVISLLKNEGILK